MSDRLHGEDVLFKPETLRLYSSVRTAHTWLRERYGDNYHIVKSTDPGPPGQFISQHDKEWWTRRRGELSVALSRIDRCAFSQFRLLKLRRELGELSDCALDELGGRNELTRSLRWSTIVAIHLLKENGDKFPNEKVRDPGLGARFVEVARRVSLLDPGNVSDTALKEAQYIKEELNNMFDSLFGKMQAGSTVVTFERDYDPFGPVFLTALLHNITIAIEKIAHRERSNAIRDQRKLLQWSCAYLRVIQDGSEEHKLPAKATLSRSAEMKNLRGLLNLTSYLAAADTDLKRTWFAQVLLRRLTVLCLAFFARHSTWASDRFNAHLAEIRRPPPAPLDE